LLLFDTSHSRQVVQERLQIIAGEANLVLDDLVVGRSSSAHQTSLRLQVEVEGVRVDDSTIDHRASRKILAAIHITTIDGIEANVVTLATDDERHLGIVARLELEE
jgi:hypothetical protein